MNERIKRIEAQLASLADEVKPLAQKSATSDLTADETKRFDELVDQLNKGKEDHAAAIEQHTKAQDALAIDKHYNQPADETVTRSHVLAQNQMGDGKSAEDMRSAGRRFVESEQYAKALKNGTFGGLKDNPVELAKLNGPDGQKALIYSGTASASALLAQVLPGIYRGAEKPLVVEDVLMSMSISSDSITVLQENVFTNAAVEVAEAINVSTGAKPESAITFTEATFPVRTIAHWLPVTRQMLEDLPFMGGYIDQRLLDGLNRRKDNQYINGDGIAPNLTGLLATSGIQDLTDAYFAGAPVQDPGTPNEAVNRIARAQTLVSTVADATATFIVANPADVEVFNTMTDANQQYLLGGPQGATVRTLWGIPVVVSQNIAAGTALVGDGTMAAVADRNQARIYTTDSHSDFFIRNIIVVLAEQRVALPVFRPSAFVKVDLTY